MPLSCSAAKRKGRSLCCRRNSGNSTADAVVRLVSYATCCAPLLWLRYVLLLSFLLWALRVSPAFGAGGAARFRRVGGSAGNKEMANKLTIVLYMRL
jgi:hypothetical protein